MPLHLHFADCTYYCDNISLISFVRAYATTESSVELEYFEGIATMFQILLVDISAHMEMDLYLKYTFVFIQEKALQFLVVFSGW